ncbi:MAG: hypothetical protein IJ561_04455 [Ruminococcus sp.]|nr:hypothetical protein [Ruminococcus sp.]
MSGYDDIIDMQYPFGLPRQRMSLSDRAAQFASFKALTGFEDEIDEAVRPTSQRPETDESAAEVIDRRLMQLNDRISQGEQPQVRIVYFVPDEKKEGGSYVTLEATVKRIDSIFGNILTAEGITIPISDIYGLYGDMFEGELT